jgi:hypothetical protein
LTKKVSPPTILRMKAMKIAFSLPKKPGFFPAFIFTSMLEVAARATIEPGLCDQHLAGGELHLQDGERRLVLDDVLWHSLSIGAFGPFMKRVV